MLTDGTNMKEFWSRSKKSSLPSGGSNRTLQNDQGTLGEQIGGILREQKLNMTVEQYLSSISALTHPGTPSTTATSPPHVSSYAREGINWAIILPSGLIGLFLFVFVTCLFWQSWKEKRRIRQFFEQHHPRDNYAYERTTDAHMATRSIGSQISSASNTLQHVQTYPPLRRQSSTYPIRTEAEVRKAGYLPPKLSPIDESFQYKVMETTTSMVEGNDEVETAGNATCSVQAGWGTPTARYTENDGSLGYENPCFSAPGKLSGNVYCDECNAMDTQFYPHINSPDTAEYDVDSEKSVLQQKGEGHGNACNVAPLRVPHVVYQPPPCLDGEDISSIITFPENSQHPQVPGGTSHVRRISFRSISDSGTLSLPSSISRFHASRQTNTPSCPFASTRNCSPTRLNFTLSSSTEVSDQYSDNTSLYPCVGSSCTSIWTQAASRPNQMPSFASGDTRSMSRSTSVPDTRNAILNVLPNLKEPCSGELDLFRTLSGTADMSSGSSQLYTTSVSCSMSQGATHHPTPVSADTDTWEQLSLEKDKLDENHNVCDLGPLPTRKVKFTVPVLVEKQYWV